MRYGLYLFISVFVILFGLELSSYYYIKNNFYEYLNFREHESFEQRLEDYEPIDPEEYYYPTLDPLLGWSIMAHTNIPETQKTNLDLNSFHGFVFNKTEQVSGFSIDDLYLEPQKRRPLIIVILGGSTTDQTFDSHAWPKYLTQLLSEHGYEAVVLNGAVAGYNSSLEFLKAMRDVAPIRPDILLTYNGVNEIGDGRLRNRPMLTAFQTSIVEKLVFQTYPFFNNLLTLVDSFLGQGPLSEKGIKFDLGMEDFTDIEKIWLDNMKMIEALSEVKGFDFISILQPYLTSGQRRFSTEEGELLNTSGNNPYVQRYESFYANIRELDIELEYFYDLTEIFDPYPEGIFKDDCHVTKKGNKIVAQEVFNIIDSQSF